MFYKADAFKVVEGNFHSFRSIWCRMIHIVCHTSYLRPPAEGMLVAEDLPLSLCERIGSGVY